MLVHSLCSCDTANTDVKRMNDMRAALLLQSWYLGCTSCMPKQQKTSQGLISFTDPHHGCAWFNPAPPCFRCGSRQPPDAWRERRENTVRRYSCVRVVRGCWCVYLRMCVRWWRTRCSCFIAVFLILPLVCAPCDLHHRRL